MYERRLTAQQKYERRQENGDKKRLAHQHWSNLLRSLSHDRDDGGQHGVVSTTPWSFTMLHVRHMMRMRIQVDTTSCEYLYRYRYGRYDS